MSQGKESCLIVSDTPAKIGPPQTVTHPCDPPGRCTRENCKYLHPPPHLKTQLEINGRNTLATQKMLQNLQNQQLQQVVGMTTGMTGVANLQLQPSPSAATLLQPTIQQGPGSHSAVIPTSQFSSKDPFYQHAAPPTYNGLQLLTQAPYHLSPTGQGQTPAVHTSQPSSDASAVYSPYFFPVPVAVSMAPSMSGSSLQSTGSYAPYLMPGLGNHATLTGLTANPGGLVQDVPGLVGTQMIPGTGPLPIMSSLKPKNDKLEVCREYQRGNCSRGETECKFAHPGEQITVDTTDNTVTVCMDHIKGRCSREKCKYFHPPLHLQAKIKAAQQQANNPNMAAVTSTYTPGGVQVGTQSLEDSQYIRLPTTPETQSLKRPRDPSEDAILSAFPGLVPPTKKSHTAGPVAAHGTGPMAMTNLFPHAPLPYHPQALTQAMHLNTQQTPVVPTPFPVMPSMPGGVPGANIPLFAPHIMPSQVYYPSKQQSNETIPVCRDFKSGSCKRPSCKYAHVTEDYVEVVDGKVTVCRDAAKGKCIRASCKYYHAPSHVAGSPNTTTATSSTSSANASLLSTAATSTSASASASSATNAALPPPPPLPQPPHPYSVSAANAAVAANAAAAAAAAAANANPLLHHYHHHASTVMPIALGNGYPAQVLP